MENLNDQVCKDNQSIQDPDDDEHNEALIRDLSPHNDQSFEEEVQQVTQNQGLSPRRMHHEKFDFKNQNVIKLSQLADQIPDLLFSRESQ